jgi:uncharacterized spore protein YtfJ
MVMEEAHEEERQPPTDGDTPPEQPGISGGQRLLDRILNRFGATARTETVFGEPREVDGVTIIPVSRAMYGFGVGSGQSEAGEGAGGGGGISVTPVGYLVTNGTGDVEFRRLSDWRRTVVLVAAGVVAGIVISRTRRRSGRS